MATGWVLQFALSQYKAFHNLTRESAGCWAQPAKLPQDAGEGCLDGSAPSTLTVALSPPAPRCLRAMVGGQGRAVRLGAGGGRTEEKRQLPATP